MAGNPFKVDWTDLSEVIVYAKKLAKGGPAQAVIKFPDRNNYNITFVSVLNEPRYKDAEVIYKTK